MGDTPDPQPMGAALPPALNRLRVLVTVLTLTMIGGVLTVIVLLVIRLNADLTPTVVHPDRFAAPPGVGIVGYSVLGEHAILVGDDGTIRVYDIGTGDLERTFGLN